MRIAIFCFVVSMFLSGCSFAPDYVRPQLELPETWSLSSEKGVPASTQWWTRFNDSILDSLVQEALQYNRDLIAAIARVDYARAQLGLSRAAFFPLISGNASTTPVWVNHKKETSGEAPYSATFSASWELDLWGKIRNAKDAALLQLLATESAQQGLFLSIAGQTATNYFLLISLDLQCFIAERTVKTREDALAIYAIRYEKGLINKLDLTRARTEVETARTALYQTRIAQRNAETALFVLLGRSPRSIMDSSVKRGKSLKILASIPVIPQDIPSELLERRPDIRQAEYLLKAANANIGVARAAWLPSISLTGLMGIVSPTLNELLKDPLKTWSYGANVSVPIIDFGRVYFNVDAAQAKEREALATYEKTVQNAFKDIYDALTRQSESTNIVKSLERMVKELRIAVGLARTRYDNGYSSYLEVLDAERALFQSELDLASAWSDRLSSIVSVCLALGGGWE